MKAILLAGGLGTRMRDETEFRPKPMVEVGGRPVLWHIMKNLAQFGIDEFIVATGYKSDMIKEYFLNYEARNNDFTIELGRRDSLVFHEAHSEANWKVTVAFTGDNTMTGGRVFRAARYLDDEPFLVTYGDGLADVNIDELRAFHAQSGRLATVTTVRPLSRFGVMDVDEGGAVRSFSEKPQLDDWINVGFFIMQPEVLTYLDDNCVLEEEPLAHLARDGQLSAFRHRGFWQPMDTNRESKMLNELWDSGNAPWKTW
ncbi:MAG: glucose-1-phosphate cytidylyltransferase [Actinomycetota bacterium]|nr:glucose-1-phosphate cytidylyltransferase [Actinomycetota bacterium]MDP2287960.1 glucose-1-phosphate cytidylyltransferase [Actinomycetota bacterium]